MIDTLLSNMGKIDKSSILNHLALKPRAYSILTLHRPSNVDSEKSLAEIFGIIEFISQQIKIIYPLHPRTKKMIKRHKFLKQFESLENLLMIDPLGYCDFIKLVKESKFVLTDSGGIQEETTCIKIPCLTIRENTERPVTLKKGTNYLVGRDKQKIARLVRNILKGKTKEGIVPKLWDGKTAHRIIELLTTKD
jgi:UDP-N-acetylglucosamine 2-epimerase (non-hydrolysing)